MHAWTCECASGYASGCACGRACGRASVRVGVRVDKRVEFGGLGCKKKVRQKDTE